MSDVFDRYFSFSDASINEPEAFTRLIGLFIEDAIIYPDPSFVFSDSSVISGIQEIRDFFEKISGQSQLLRHVWTPPRFDSEERVSVDWAVAGVRNGGAVFCMRGVDTAELDESGRIKRLTIEPFRETTDSSTATTGTF